MAWQLQAGHVSRVLDDCAGMMFAGMMFGVRLAVLAAAAPSTAAPQFTVPCRAAPRCASIRRVFPRRAEASLSILSTPISIHVRTKENARYRTVTDTCFAVDFFVCY